MDNIALLVGIALAINKVVSVIKALASKDRNTPVTQLIVWLVGFGGLALAANAQVTASLVIPGVNTTLGSLDWQSLLLLAVILGSSGSFAYDFKKAIDNTDTATEPALLAPPPGD